MGGGGSSGGNVTQTSTVQLNPQQSKLFDLAFPKAEQYANSNLSVFPGTAIEDFNPLEKQAQDYTANTAAPINAGLAQQAAGTNSLMMNPSFMLNPNQYVQGAADATTRQVTQNLNENILPQVQAQSTAAGGMYSGGSTRQGIAEGLAIGKTNQGLSNSIADMYYKNYLSGLSGMGDAVNRTPAVIQEQSVYPTMLSAVGGQQRMMEQAKLDEQVNKFYTEQSLPFLQASDVIGLVNGIPGATNTSSVTGAQPRTNPLMQGLGLMSTLGGLFGGGGGGGGAAPLAALALK
jgi:hypothetical protein